MKHKTRITVAIACLTLASGSLLHAQGSGTPESALAGAGQSEMSEQPETYGTSSDTSYNIGAYDFTLFTSTVTTGGQGGTGDRFFTSAGGFFLSPVRIPNGALITRIEIQGCDTSAGGQVFATLYSNTTIGGVQSEIGHGSVGTGATPGCGFFSATFGGGGVTVTNQTRTYYVQVTTGTTDNTNRFSAVRLFYRLQISAGPGAATFPNDVPTSHPLFRFVEALAAAGVTGGCGAGSYCPNNPITRGEMAVFLATALGLHFPN